MLVSIVAPIYRHEKYLAACLDSIYAQDWDDLELVLIDDCSPDQSFELAKSICATRAFASRFRNIQLRRNAENKGAAETISAAIAAANGDIIMIVNTDDLYSSARVTTCATAIDAEHQFVYSGIQCIDALGYRNISREAADFEFLAASAKEFPVGSLAFMECNRAISTGNFCFTRELYTRVGPFRDLSYCHDWDFLLRCCLHTEPRMVPDQHYFYRLHGDNSFRALDAIADRESRFVLSNFFHVLLGGRATNEELATLARTPGFFDALLAPASGTPWEEWQAACRGERPRSLPPTHAPMPI